MPAVFVHGVPETPRIWDPLLRELDRSDVVTLQLPGFGCPRPDGFGSTKEEYADWLIGEVERIGADGPVDLVGHDWGGGVTVRLVSVRPELVRTWVSDAVGLGDPDFEWHDFAKIWQTPGEGEQFFEQQLAAPPEERTGVFEMFGVPHDEALALAGSIDKTMTDSILALYRSAVDVGREWGPEFRDVSSPGFAIVPSEDAFLNEQSARKGAAAAGAPVVELAGLGHWWMLQDPALGADVLREAWSSPR
ncbi:MAG: alpha/beta fold hydrolase [Actinomycetota bacterium]